MTEDMLKHIVLARTRIGTIQRSLDMVSQELDDNLERAIALATNAQKVVTTGLGKSGFIARKMAATLTSLGSPAYYIHPVDALHGDSGMQNADDCVVAFSKGGETSEILRFIDHSQHLGIPIVAITSRKHSSLASRAQAVLFASLEQELDSANIVPTTSTTTAMVLADLLCLAIADSKGPVVAQLRQSHPNGGIGAGLLQTVDEVMHTGENLPVVHKGTTFTAALVELTAKGLGAVCVIDAAGTLQGLLTDGDVRRLVLSGKEATDLAVEDVMTSNPVTTPSGATLHEALMVMERRDKQLSLLPVVVDGRCVGIVRVHDIVRASL